MVIEPVSFNSSLRSRMRYPFISNTIVSSMSNVEHILIKHAQNDIRNYLQAILHSSQYNSAIWIKNHGSHSCRLFIYPQPYYVNKQNSSEDMTYQDRI
jgi:hypothetical protein